MKTFLIHYTHLLISYIAETKNDTRCSYFVLFLSLLVIPTASPSNHCCLFKTHLTHSRKPSIPSWRKCCGTTMIFLGCDNNFLMFNLLSLWKTKIFAVILKYGSKIKMNTRFLLLKICQHAMLYLSCLSSWLSYLATTFYGTKCMNIFLCTWTYRLFTLIPSFFTLFKKCFNFFKQQ